MHPIRRILNDRQAAGLLAGLVIYLMIVQAALASAVCSMTAGPPGGAADGVICTLHGPEPDGGAVPSHDCQCQLGCQHCAPAAVHQPASAGVVAAVDGASAPALRPTRSILRPGPASAFRRSRAPPRISV